MKNYARILNYVCVVLMLVLLVTQFLPFWSCEKCEDGVASISDYTWFPNDHKPITTEMKEIYGRDYLVTDVVLTSILILVASGLGIFFCIKDARKPLSAIFPLAAGLCGVVGYLTTPGLQTGENWVIHVAVAAVLAVCALGALSQLIVNLVKAKAASKK